MATPTIEEYLQTIYAMQNEDAPVISARVAERIGVSAPTMTDTLKRMAKQGYVEVDARKEIVLTEKGKELAESLVRRHRLSERWLTDVLGLDWSTAHREACKLEHAISAEVEARLSRALHNPSTCPHGNPIPSPGSPLPAAEGAVALSQVTAGDEVTVDRISPAAEDDPKLLDYLHRNNLVPGAHFTVLDIVQSAGVMTLARGDTTLSIGLQAAAHVWVHVNPRP